MDNFYIGLARKITRLKAHLGLDWNTEKLYYPVSDVELERYSISPKEQIDCILKHMVDHGKRPPSQKRPRVFLSVHHVNWEKPGLIDSWAKVADIVHYDWGKNYDQYASGWHKRGKPEFNKELVDRVLKAHKETPFDLFFSYLSGRWVYPQSIRAIGELGIITVNISFDDTVKFWGYREPGGLSGNAEIAGAFDVCVTCQSPQDVAKYNYVGANPLFLPPAATPYDLPAAEVNIPVSFIGQRYGRRQEIIETLQAHGLPIHTYGKGWPGGEISHEDKIEIQARSLINIGFGYIDGAEERVGLKGRDFETPLSGNMYLTSYNPALEECFNIGQEIDCFHDTAELIDKIKYYLTHRSETRRIGQLGRERCFRDHTWEKRFQTLLGILSFSKQS